MLIKLKHFFSELRAVDSDVLDAPEYLMLVSSELTSLHVSWADDFNEEKSDEFFYELSYYRCIKILLIYYYQNNYML